MWRDLHGDKPTPKLGLSRFIVIAETTKMPSPRRGAPIPYGTNISTTVFFLGGKPAHPRPAEFDERMEIHQAVAGDPETVMEFLLQQADEWALNFLVGQFAFGDLSLAESLRSVGCFEQYAMPNQNKRIDETIMEKIGFVARERWAARFCRD